MGCILKGGGGLYSRIAVGSILLAAGSGSRMGNRPKSLLELGGIALIRRQIIALSGAGVDELVVVLGHHAERIALAVQEFPVTVVHNPDPDAGQVSSLRIGLQALSPKIDTVLVALADQPLINSQDINDLIGAYKKRPAGTLVVQPEVDGQPGNPVMFSGEVREQILAGEARLGCKQWQAAHPEQVHRWATTNQRYRTDVDTPEDIEALATRTGHRLRWPTDLLSEA
ncbi:MAG: nucleotidyltransferase family protein [Hydrogenophaga sp.]|uniref:nucleotidyltransferase family protein n=1 Tax=Hydrogenophaga sp. TaxID=1904254 RepID=UPI001BC11651|nr:nucleotidyltransferase family protein [Hydrogenophaga sp.]MBS3910451.1 nucleotidyltransferase family protein [Hydrogenophaga sp.]MDO9146378.1 nucleotidyltransferase family protein [Hydrogenophaga sp.]MDO9604611.1 nucleotidyltransferase family protein [Hydrogenophaga sp.]MDP2165616.1 nucleotidyltransferase family protein [Hydrogenophaga sp.]MDP3476471.1 nucleotidyltransferase family protein [Hydrogenophaga sp.]